MKKIVIPTILAATILVAGMFALMPVYKASAVHTTILAAIAGIGGAGTADNAAQTTALTANNAAQTTALTADNAAQTTALTANNAAQTTALTANNAAQTTALGSQATANCLAIKAVFTAAKNDTGLAAAGAAMVCT